MERGDDYGIKEKEDGSYRYGTLYDAAWNRPACEYRL